MHMGDSTPRPAELFERYDRSCLRIEEQIGCGMPPGIPETLVLWYEVGKAVQLLTVRICFKSSVTRCPPIGLFALSITPVAEPCHRPGDRSGSRARWERRHAR